MNMFSKRLLGAVIFFAILFVNASFATQEKANEVFKEILGEMTIGTITITRQGDAIADSTVLPVPTVVISRETVEEAIPSGWTYEFSREKGAIVLKDADGNEYSQTLYIQNSTGYSIPPDTAVGQLTVDRDMHVNTEGLSALMNGNGISDKVSQMYIDETGESITEDDYFCLTYGAFEVNQNLDQDTATHEQASIYKLGAKTNFVFNSLDDYNARECKLNGSASASLTVQAFADSNGKMYVKDINQITPDDIVLTPVTITGLNSGDKKDIVVEADNNKLGKIYFNITEPRIYYLQLYDDSGVAVEMTQEMLFRVIGNNEERPACVISGGKIQATLNENSQYYIKTPETGKGYRLEITAGTTHVGEEPVSSMAQIDDPKKGDSLFEKIEKLVAQLIMGVSKTLNFLLSNALDQTITMDDIVFNSYSEIRLDFFKYDLNGQAVPIGDSETSTINLLRDAITTWYKNFRMIALTGYMVILVYISIKILMNSTTPDAKAKAKEMAITWIMGIALLTFFPYMMKFIIVLNDSIVKYIDEGRSYKDRTTSSVDPSLSQGLVYTDYDNVINFDGNDYMSMVGKLASEKLKLGFALTYLILTWQLIMLVIYYYKRLFITAFLIIIFPLIALMYAWDKLNDGRSQSLSMWVREFAMTVFVQTFHAIVYVFVIDVIYSTMDANSYDFILLMIASSFLFAGENILKSIFGGGGEALGSVAQTAGKVAIIATTITKVGTRVVSNVVSKDGFVRKGMASFGEARKWHLLNKRGPDGMRNIDLLATNEATERRLNRLLPSEGEVTPTIRKAAEVVDTFNNLDKKKPEEIAKAREEFDRLMKKRKDGSMTPDERRQFDAIMQHSNININQLEKVDNAMANAAIAYGAAGSSKKARKTITQNLQLEIEVIINSADPRSVSKENISKSTNNVIHAGLINMRKNGISGLRRDDVSNTAREKVQNSNRVYNKINFLSKGGAGGTKNGTAKNPTAKNVRAKAIADRYKSSLDAKGQKIDEHTKQMIDNFAHKLADFEDVGVRDVDINAAYDMINDLPTNTDEKEMLNQMAKLANLQAEIEDLKYLISKKAVSDTSVTPDMQQKFSAIVDSMESKAVSPSASVDVPAYTVSVNIANDRNDVSVDPYISIMDIINASNDNGGDINDFNNMINAAANSTAIDQIVDSKMNNIRTGNQERWSESKDFAEETLKYFEKITKDYEHDEKTYMGYTASEAKKMERAAYGDFVTNAAGMLSDVVTLPAGAVFGAAVGAAYTTDGMPLGEMAGGVAAGTRIASDFSDKVVPSFANAAERQKTKSSIEDKVKNRLETSENETLRARNLFENAQYANRGNADTYLTLDGFTANLIVDSNDNLTAILHIMAQNAEYVCVNEQPGAGNWQSFQENMSYTFRDNDYNKTHSLYVYVKDASGNIKNSVQYNLRA